MKIFIRIRHINDGDGDPMELYEGCSSSKDILYAEIIAEGIENATAIALNPNAYHEPEETREIQSNRGCRIASNLTDKKYDEMDDLYLSNMGWWEIRPETVEVS